MAYFSSDLRDTFEERRYGIQGDARADAAFFSAIHVGHLCSGDYARQARLNGRPVGTRTLDLYRVNGDIKYLQQLPRLLRTAKYLIIPSSRTHLGLAFGLKKG